MAHPPKDRDEDRPGGREPSKPPSATTTSLGSLLRAANASSAASPPARKQARHVPLHPRLPSRNDPEKRALELAARKRVAALLSGGVHFKIREDAGRIHGERGSGSAKLAARVGSKHFLPEVTLDLRARPAADTEEAIANFVRTHHRRGVRQLSIVFDPAPDGDEAASALEAIVAALTRGQSAALVRAFSSAHENLGGAATLAVLLI
jgi:DNA-nicking Smr family endonuclease